jgi:transcriptional regulator with XRE-family HTH domain
VYFCIFVTIAHIIIYFGGITLSNINNYNNAIIAEKIKKECMRQNITIKSMLKELNINVNAVQQMQKNDSTPNYKSIARICDYLNISVDTLLERPIPEPEPVSLSAAINTVAAAAHISPDALRAVLHLPINDK